MKAFEKKKGTFVLQHVLDCEVPQVMSAQNPIISKLIAQQEHLHDVGCWTADHGLYQQPLSACRPWHDCVTFTALPASTGDPNCILVN